MTARALVLIHGAGCDHHAWDELRGALGVSSHAFDLPGRGDSPGPPAETATAAAQAVLARLAAAGLRPEDVTVVGHSYGGAVAIECAFLAPLAGLALISTGARLRVHPLVISAMRANAAASATTGASIGWRPGTSRSLIERYDAAAMHVPSSTTLTDWLAADKFDRLADVRRIAVPTLVIGGTADELTPPKYARYLATTIPNAKLTLLEDAGHMCIVEDGARIAVVLRGTSASAAG